MPARIARGVAMRAFSALILLTLSMILTGASPATGQTSTSGRSQMEIQNLIQKSAALQRQALQSLNDPRRTERLVSDAYADLQAALSAMIINASGAKFPDPLLDVQRKRAEQALRLLQAAVDALKSDSGQPSAGAPRENQDKDDRPASSPSSPQASLDLVRNNLEQALRLTSTLAF